MHTRGRYILRSLLGSANGLVMAGPVVIKKLGGRNAPRKFYSEVEARSILDQVGIGVVPVLARLAAARVIVMPRVSATLNKTLTRERLRAFGDHVLSAAAREVPQTTPGGYYWVDFPRRRRTYDSFVDFLMGEFAAVEDEFRGAYPGLDVAAVRVLFRRASELPKRILVLTDVAPKNVVYDDGRFVHLDLEATLIGPPEFLLVRAAVNLATDQGGYHDARSVRRRLLDACSCQDTARACLASSLTRRLLYESRAKRHDQRPLAALETVLEGGSLNDAIAHLEASWDARPDDASAREGGRTGTAVARRRRG